MRINVRHIAFWIVIYFAWTYMKSGNVLSPIYLVVNVVNVAIYMVAFYSLSLILIPRLFRKGKIFYFILSLVLASTLFYLIWRLLGVWWMDEFRGFPNSRFMTPANFLIQTVQFYSPAMALLAWDSYYERKKEQERLQLLENEKLKTELKYLKAQLNPHFLFNTLNNLYSFVINKSDKAPAMIMGLSGMLDYILYKSQNTSVPLSEEVQAINNLVELEKIRYGERLSVELAVSGDLSLPVSPLLFLSLVENAFKHGASGDINNPRIAITIQTMDGKAVKCVVHNTKSHLTGELNDEYREGIGLSNVKRQLDLAYPEKHTLSIVDQQAYFQVSVHITVKDEEYTVPAGG